MTLSKEPLCLDVLSPPLKGEQTILSRGEVESLCLKAARGAGMAWGLAEEAGFSAGWLWARGFDGTQRLLDHLLAMQISSGYNKSPLVMPRHWQAPEEGRLCPILLGVTLCDYMRLPEGLVMSGPLLVGPVNQPLLVLPFLAAMAAKMNKPVCMAWQGEFVLVTSEGELVSSVAYPVFEEGLFEVSIAESVSYGIQPTGRHAVRDTTLSMLNDFAIKTTVMISDQSRADAGAGIEDND